MKRGGSFREQRREPMGSHIFGCDICQDVCPWNRKSPRSQLPEFQPREIAESVEQTPAWPLFQPDLLRIATLSEQRFREIFRGSPIKRTKWRGLVRNACIALGNAEIPRNSDYYQEILATLERLCAAEDPAVSESARWALSRIKKTRSNADSTLHSQRVERSDGEDV